MSNGDGNDKGNVDGSKINGDGNKEGKGGKSNGNSDKEGNGGSSNNGNGNKEARTKAARGMILATKRARERARVARWMAMATKRARATATRVAGKKKAIARATKRAMVMATTRAMVTNGNNMGNGYGKEGGGRLMAATMGTVQRTRPLAL